MLLEEFSTIFDRPEKVKNLREYILSLAVRGKLVSQDESDEPASVLLERIREEKERLVKEKKIKKEKALPEIREDEIPYELPEGWGIAYFQDITSCITCGLASTPKYIESGRMFLSAKNVKPYRFMPDDHRFISEEDFLKLTKNSKPEINDILLTRVGAGIGEAAIIDQELEFAIYVSLTLIKPIHLGIDSKYMLHFLNSPDGVSKSLGNTFGKGVSQGNLNVNQVRKFIIPIPPLNEQKRIVEKVDYLMKFCDKLEVQLEKKVKYGTLSTKSALNSVSNCSSYEELEEALRFIIENFKDLTLSDGAVGELKNAILSLAVKGKLVPQDDGDEPASVLLERIREEKERLVKEKKIKKEKSLPEIGEDEIPYELPRGWEWIRLGDCVQINPRNNVDDDLDTSFVPMKLIDDGFSNSHTFETKKWSEIKKGFTHFAERDVVVAKITPCFENRKSAVMKNLINGVGAGTTELYVIRSLIELILPEYILTVFKTHEFIKGGVDTYTGTAGQQRVKKDYVSNLVVGIPPLNEQKRIVEKVEKLMKVCDELELRIEASKKYNEQLMESILKESLKA
ncbi:restriction endonuclease subunit S [Intestinibacter bartlettii]|uniref:restriction endonuclease subunit S n=1 Tax=Intestinibacter bartlettii TaxID=261299 RepID=UPI0034A50756